MIQGYPCGKFPRFRLGTDLGSKTLESWSSKYSWDHKESGLLSPHFLVSSISASTSWPMISTRIFWSPTVGSVQHQPCPQKPQNNSRDGNSTCSHAWATLEWRNFSDISSKLSSLSLRSFWERSPWDPAPPWLYLMQVWVFFTQFITLFKPKKDVYLDEKAKRSHFLSCSISSCSLIQGWELILGWDCSSGELAVMEKEIPWRLLNMWKIPCGFSHLPSRLNNQ